MEILARAAVAALRFTPRTIVRRIASRYIAGETRAEALAVVRSLEEAGCAATIDLLGEELKTEADVGAARDEYLRLLDDLAAAGVRSPQVSVKPTLMGLRLGEDVARRELGRLVERAAPLGISVCIDMEDSTTTDATLRLFRELRGRFDNVWVAIQACLRRSPADLAALLPLRPWVRVCKGIYREREEIAHQEDQAIRENYLELVRLLARGGGSAAIATHDPWLLDRSLEIVRSERVEPPRFEVEMLLGVGEPLRGRILAGGTVLRIYCPYGPDWAAYSIRRLRENPRIAAHILQQILRRRWRG
jgi:proline dehydrogenase